MAIYMRGWQLSPKCRGRSAGYCSMSMGWMSKFVKAVGYWRLDDSDEE